MSRESRRSGLEVAEEAWRESIAGYRPAFTLGNERDTALIAQSIRRARESIAQPDPIENVDDKDEV